MREIGRFPRHRNPYKEKKLVTVSTKPRVTFNTQNFKSNAVKVYGAIKTGQKKLKKFGNKHPNLRDPSWMLKDGWLK